uniref:Proteasome alpha-type subunits domain-containing protein n=1 Tax=Amphora coffeiformis TaxID=265554 RepID=A0A7S3L343_9STRA|mmetsp:Transcript_12075/g.23204  ORF Transcript_12075/g.23204 Transcript_12075/m.23204 type:complete len:290 (+) Transcript_12075:128-997(+)
MEGLVHGNWRFLSGLFASQPRIFLVLTLLIGWTTVAVSSSNYSPYQYDHTTPCFTPDGRLLQVEYAAKAVDDFAAPLVIVPLNETVRAIVALSPQKSLLERLVVLSSAEKSLIVAISGVLPDGMALLQDVQDYFRQQQRLGISASARSCAMYAAGLCHQHAMGGGIRPYGARLTIIEDDTAWVTDPSGTLQAVSLPTGGTSGGNHPPALVLTGDGGNLSRNLAKIAAQGLGGLPLLQKTIQECLNAMKAAGNTGEYRLKVVLWSSDGGNMYRLLPGQVDQLVEESSSLR